MNSKFKQGQRMYHAIFGWCKIHNGIETNGKILVDLEADEISYYEIGFGRKRSVRNKETGDHILYTPINQLFETDKTPRPKELLLKKAGYAPELVFW